MTDLLRVIVPQETQIYEADGLWIKQIEIDEADALIPQHSHALSHLTLLTNGSLLVWKDGKFIGRYDAPCGIYIEAGVKHTFATLTDRTVLYCVHSLATPEALKVLEEHHIL